MSTTSTHQHFNTSTHFRMSIFQKTEAELKTQGFEFERTDFNRPWGGFFVIEENQAAQFTATYFPGMDNEDLIDGRKVSPKILLVAPEKRLSWQYHHRRSEVWRVIEGEVGIVRSDTDKENELEIFKVGDVITLKKGERHRLVGLSDWGKVAEIWQHTEPNNPSDEEDIVRLQDDFGR
jgi:mannose-6-phosphate isomerase-like protein (cupin superfamily)